MSDDPPWKDPAPDLTDYAGAPSLGEQMETGEIANFWDGVEAKVVAAFAAVTLALSALWRGVLDLPRTLRRAHVRLVVRFAPEDVTDSQQLYERTFAELGPPRNADHEHYRRTICLLCVVERTPEQDLQFAQYLRGMREYGEDPLKIWIERAWARKRAPPTMPQPQVQGLLAAPIPGLGMLSQVLAAALVLSLGWGLWRNHVAEHAQGKLDDVKEELAGATVANEALAARMSQAEQAMAKSNAVLADYEQRIADAAKLDAARAARQAAIRRRSQERTHEVAEGDTARRPDDDWLRELAGPASSNDPPVPAGAHPAAPAGLFDGVSGNAGGDAAAHDLPGAGRIDRPPQDR